MRISDVVKIIKAEIDQDERQIEDLRVKLLYSYELLDKIDNGDKQKKKEDN